MPGVNYVGGRAYLIVAGQAGNVLRGGGAAATQELHEHQGLVDEAHPHAPRNGVAQALVGGGGGWGHPGGGLGRLGRSPPVSVDATGVQMP